MCTGCMELTTIMHDESIMVDPETVDIVVNAMEAHAKDTSRPFEASEMGLLLVLIGSRFIDWDNI